MSQDARALGQPRAEELSGQGLKQPALGGGAGAGLRGGCVRTKGQRDAKVGHSKGRIDRPRVWSLKQRSLERNNMANVTSPFGKMLF